MEATTVQPTLLSAARSFIRKSAGTAVIAIAPLAALTVANEAKGQVVFSPSGSFYSSGLSFAGGTASLNSGGYFDSQLSDLGGIAGFSQGVNVSFNFSGMASGSGTVTMPLVSFTGTISADTTIPVAYNFTLSSTGSASVPSWSLLVEVAPDSYQQIASGSGFGTFSGTNNYIQSADADHNYAVFQLAFDYTGQNGDNIYLTMNPGSQGLFFNATAIPEPSTYALLGGLGAFALAVIRRRRGFTAS